MKFVPQTVTRNFARTVLKAKKNSPHIFFAAGVVGSVTSTVMACKATLRLEPIVDETRGELDDIRQMKNSNDYSEQDRMKDLGFVYGKSITRVAKLYGPSVVVGVVSVASLTGAHVQLSRRNTALMATLSAVSRAYEEYRERVQQEIGEERELAIYRGQQDTTDKKTGEIVTTFNPGGVSPYARFFDELNPNWKPNAEWNRMFLTAQQNYWNHRLQARGHVFLNEIYGDLGMEHSSEGQIVGWLSEGSGDGYIDFNMFDPGNSRFINGIEHSVLLDFNVDGPVFDKI